MSDVARSFREATESFQLINRAFDRFNRSTALSRRAEHFATPWWQRSYWRLRARIVRAERFFD